MITSVYFCHTWQIRMVLSYADKSCLSKRAPVDAVALEPVDIQRSRFTQAFHISFFNLHELAELILVFVERFGQFGIHNRVRSRALVGLEDSHTVKIDPLSTF